MRLTRRRPPATAPPRWRRLRSDRWPAAIGAAAQAAAKEWRHGLSLFGELKYPRGLQAFRLRQSGAPKGGTVRQIAFGTFDNFNLVVAGVKGTIAAGIELSTRR